MAAAAGVVEAGVSETSAIQNDHLGRARPYIALELAEAESMMDPEHHKQEERRALERPIQQERWDPKLAEADSLIDRQQPAQERIPAEYPMPQECQGSELAAEQHGTQAHVSRWKETLLYPFCLIEMCGQVLQSTVRHVRSEQSRNLCGSFVASDSKTACTFGRAHLWAHWSLYNRCFLPLDLRI